MGQFESRTSGVHHLPTKESDLGHTEIEFFLLSVVLRAGLEHHILPELLYEVSQVNVHHLAKRDDFAVAHNQNPLEHRSTNREDFSLRWAALCRLILAYAGFLITLGRRSRVGPGSRRCTRAVSPPPFILLVILIPRIFGPPSPKVNPFVRARTPLLPQDSLWLSQTLCAVLSPDILALGPGF